MLCLVDNKTEGGHGTARDPAPSACCGCGSTEEEARDRKAGFPRGDVTDAGRGVSACCRSRHRDGKSDQGLSRLAPRLLLSAWSCSTVGMLCSGFLGDPDALACSRVLCCCLPCPLLCFSLLLPGVASWEIADIIHPPTPDGVRDTAIRRHSSPSAGREGFRHCLLTRSTWASQRHISIPSSSTPSPTFQLLTDD